MPAARPLLILLPGLDGTGLMFGPFLAALEGVDTQVVRYPSALTSYPACLHFVRTQLPRERPFLLLGESFSGPVALALAAERPAGLQALVLCGTFARSPRPRLARLAPLLGLLPARRLPERILRWILLGTWATPELVALARAMGAEASPGAMKARLRAVAAVDHTALLARIQVPALALAGSRDRLVPRTALGWLRAHLPGLDVVTLDGPHWLLQARPGACAQALRDFLARLRPAPTWT